MSDTRWGDVLLFVVFQIVPLLVWLRMRPSRPADSVESPRARVIPMTPYVPPAEPEVLRRVLSHS
jgi:hypothetical protein